MVPDLRKITAGTLLKGKEKRGSFNSKTSGRKNVSSTQSLARKRAPRYKTDVVEADGRPEGNTLLKRGGRKFLSGYVRGKEEGKDVGEKALPRIVPLYRGAPG